MAYPLNWHQQCFHLWWSTRIGLHASTARFWNKFPTSMQALQSNLRAQTSTYILVSKAKSYSFFTWFFFNKIKFLFIYQNWYKCYIICFDLRWWYFDHWQFSWCNTVIDFFATTTFWAQRPWSTTLLPYHEASWTINVSLLLSQTKYIKDPTKIKNVVIQTTTYVNDILYSSHTQHL